MTNVRFVLPDCVRQLVSARNELRRRYESFGLTFTIDGNLVGDLGEAVAAELFDVSLVARNGEGIDGKAPDGRTVQVKASGVGGGAAFRPTETRADHLLFFHFEYETCSGEVVYNGPEAPVIASFPPHWIEKPVQRMARVHVLRRLNEQVEDADRLQLRDEAKVIA